tara:strand:- start:38 stop:541 length:504 start_codon:yes stop_codon:yes gene_type:complete
MRAELLAKLLPKSSDLENIGGVNHNAITSDDINIRLSYSKITDSELNLLLAKFLDDEQHRSNLFWELYKFAKEVVGKKNGRKYLEVAIMERIMTACPFCNGTGITIFKDKIDKCHHCREGTFIYSDEVISSLIGIKKKNFEKKKYNEIINKLINLEHSALSKIGANE